LDSWVVRGPAASLLAAWGICADLNGDGLVNVIDLLTLLANWS